MASDPTRKRGRRNRTACDFCRENRRKCSIEKSGAICTECATTGKPCSLSIVLKKQGIEEKKEVVEIENSSDSESIRSHRATSSTTVVSFPASSDAPPLKKARITAPPQARLRKSSRTPRLPKDEPDPERDGLDFDACILCEKPHKGNSQHDKTMLQCDNAVCGRWCHLTCLWSPKYTKRMFLFCTKSVSLSQDENIFFCHKCFEGEETKGREQHLSHALSLVMDIIGSTKNQLNGTQQESLLKARPRHKNKKVVQQKTEVEEQANESDMGEPSNIAFDPPREKFLGFNSRMINDTLRRINDVVYDYDRAVGKAVDQYDDAELKKKPLQTWSIIDPCGTRRAGQEWHAELNEQPPGHTSLTAALRKLLKIKERQSFDLAPHLHELSFSQVNRALVNWFIFDVLDKLSLYDLPNMKPLKAMKSAIVNFGNERWPDSGMGKHVLREIQLRSWPKMEQQNLDLNQDSLADQLKAYLKPLTKDYDNESSSWDIHIKEIIDHATALWLYLNSIGGKLEMIHPSIGDADAELFDPSVHEAYDEEYEQIIPAKNSKKTVKWILRRGFKYTENGFDGPRWMIVKAHVVI